MVMKEDRSTEAKPNGGSYTASSQFESRQNKDPKKKILGNSNSRTMKGTSMTNNMVIRKEYRERNVTSSLHDNRLNSAVKSNFTIPSRLHMSRGKNKFSLDESSNNVQDRYSQKSHKITSKDSERFGAFQGGNSRTPLNDRKYVREVNSLKLREFDGMYNDILKNGDIKLDTRETSNVFTGRLHLNVDEKSTRYLMEKIKWDEKMESSCHAINDTRSHLTSSHEDSNSQGRVDQIRGSDPNEFICTDVDSIHTGDSTDTESTRSMSIDTSLMPVAKMGELPDSELHTEVSITKEKLNSMLIDFGLFHKNVLTDTLPLFEGNYHRLPANQTKMEESHIHAVIDTVIHHITSLTHVPSFVLSTTKRIALTDLLKLDIIYSVSAISNVLELFAPRIDTRGGDSNVVFSILVTSLILRDLKDTIDSQLITSVELSCFRLLETIVTRIIKEPTEEFPSFNSEEPNGEIDILLYILLAEYIIRHAIYSFAFWSLARVIYKRFNGNMIDSKLSQFHFATALAYSSLSHDPWKEMALNVVLDDIGIYTEVVESIRFFRQDHETGRDEVTRFSLVNLQLHHFKPICVPSLEPYISVSEGMDKNSDNPNSTKKTTLLKRELNRQRRGVCKNIQKTTDQIRNLTFESRSTKNVAKSAHARHVRSALEESTVNYHKLRTESSGMDTKLHGSYRKTKKLKKETKERNRKDLKGN